jgi:hypothetical protein
MRGPRRAAPVPPACSGPPRRVHNVKCRSAGRRRCSSRKRSSTQHLKVPPDFPLACDVIREESCRWMALGKGAPAVTSRVRPERGAPTIRRGLPAPRLLRRCALMLVKCDL